MQIHRLFIAAGAAASLSLTGCGMFGGQSEEKLTTATEEPVASAQQAPSAEQTPAEQVASTETEAAEPASAYKASYGLRRKFAYQYHPELEIYYSPESGTYYWQDGQKWVSGEELPTWHDDFAFSDTVRITLNTDEPYTRHDFVVRAHPGYARAGEAAQPAFTGVETDR